MKKWLIILFLILMCLPMSLVHAEGEVNLTEFDNYLADQLGISDFAGGILAGMIFLMLFLFPCLLLTKGKNVLLLVIVGMGIMGFNVAVGYFPIWSLIVVAMIVALMFAGEMRTLITGRSGG